MEATGQARQTPTPIRFRFRPSLALDSSPLDDRADYVREARVFLDSEGRVPLKLVSALFDVDPSSISLHYPDALETQVPLQMSENNEFGWSSIPIDLARLPSDRTLTFSARPLFIDEPPTVEPSTSSGLTSQLDPENSLDAPKIPNNNEEGVVDILSPYEGTLCDLCGRKCRLRMFRSTHRYKHFSCLKCYLPRENLVDQDEWALHFPQSVPGRSFRNFKSAFFNETLFLCFDLYSDLPFLGLCSTLTEPPSLTGSYHWRTYGQVYRRILDYSTGLGSTELKTGTFIGLGASPSENWVIAWMSNLYKGFGTVPLSSALTIEQLQYVMDKTDMKAAFVDLSMFSKVIEAAATFSPLKVSIIIHSNVSESTLRSAKEKFPQLKFESFDSIESRGSATDKKAEIFGMGPDFVHAVTFTSGSTGNPKGAPEMAYKTLNYLSYVFANPGESPYVALEYMPFAHGLGRDNLLDTLCHGGRVAIFDRDLKYLFEDTALIRPTKFFGVPAIWNSFCSNFHEELKKELEVLQKKFKRDDSDLKIQAEIHRVTSAVRTKYRNMLGGRLNAIAVGTAKISKEVLQALRGIFVGCRVDEAYGMTEVGGVATNGYIHDDNEWKILDVPELGYFSTDTPYPRGELIIKTTLMIEGYYSDEMASNSNFIDGWFHTGDIVEVLHQERAQINIIDRRKFILKLANGEFVAPSELETVFSQTELIGQIYVHGDLSEDSLVAIVVPNFEKVSETLSLKNLPVPSNLEDLVASKVAVEVIVKALEEIAVSKSVAAYEIPRGVVLTLTRFTPENGLLTASLKTCRRNLAEHFRSEISDLYRQIKEAASELKMQILKALENDQVDREATLGQQGLSSIAAVQLALALKKANPSAHISPASLANSTLKDLLKTKAQPLARRYKNPTILVKEDLKELAIPPTLILSQEPRPSDRTTVLLTGATGFLGSAILQSLLLKSSNVNVICLVRPQKGSDPLARLKASLKWWHDMEPSLWDRVMVCDGSLGSDMLEMSEEVFDGLCHGVDLIIHCAARVHWIDPYGALRGDNVLMTHRLLKIATTHRLKRFIFVSTMSAAADFSEGLPHLASLGLDSLDGYALSKMVSELLVAESARNNAFEALILRPPFILPHSKYPLVNPTDFIYRLFHGIRGLKSKPEFSDNDGVLGVHVDALALNIASIVTNESWDLEKIGSNGSLVCNVSSRPIHFGNLFQPSSNEVQLRTEFDYPTWVDSIEEAGPSNPLFPLVQLLRNRTILRLPETQFTSSNWKSLLTSVSPSSKVQSEEVDYPMTLRQSLLSSSRV